MRVGSLVRGVAVIMALAFALAWSSSAMAAPSLSPAWSLSVRSYPTDFTAGSIFAHGTKAGPGFRLYATNVGGAPTSGTFTLTDTLPAGVTPAASTEPDGSYGAGNHHAEMTCETTGQTVTCVGGLPGQPDLASGQAVIVHVPLNVDPGALGSVTDTAEVSGGSAGGAQGSAVTSIDSGQPFGFLSGPEGLFGSSNDTSGGAVEQAGSHPANLVVGMSFPSFLGPGQVLEASGGSLRDASVTLPGGVSVNPEAAPKCTEAQLEGRKIECPPGSQIGLAAVETGALGAPGVFLEPLFNMEAPPGSPANFGFSPIESVYVHILGRVKSDGSYELGAESNDVFAKLPVLGVRVELWGNPSAESHDATRVPCIISIGGSGGLCPVPRNEAAFVTMPSGCSSELDVKAKVDDWLEPGVFTEAESPLTDGSGAATSVTGCGGLEFEPSITSRPTDSTADSSSGLDFDLHQRQNEGYEGLATAALKEARVTLPAGMALNPASAAGRDACSAAQIGLATAPGQSPIRFKEEPQACPSSAKLGTVEVETPLLDHPLSGGVYLAKPFDNPFDSLLAIYLAIEDPRTGIVAKLPGQVEPDPGTGQLSTTFLESPQLPIEDIRLHLFGGARGALTTPLTCGGKTTTSRLTPWSTPEGADAMPSDSFTVTTAPAGAPCSPTEAQAPNAPTFLAGTNSVQAGAYSPVVLHLARGDGSQRVSAIDTTLPEGLTGKLAGIPYCSDAQIAAAEARSHPNEGALEQQSPSCPQASEVGTVTVGAGSGSSPLYVKGTAYLAGPYKGAPLSLAIVTPAVAGPFDLGNVVVRTALYVNLETAQIHAVSDPLPTIIQGIPLDVRSIALEMDRPQFTLNPTSCEPKTILGAATSLSGAVASLSQRFQVGECSRLKFAPKLSIQLKGPTKRSGHPALKAVVTYPKGGEYANIARAQVSLPHSEFLDQGNLDKVCTQPELKSDTCPAGAVYGRAKAWSPLLEKPLEGPVYLGVGFGHELPDLVADLNGQIRFLLHGKVDTTKKDGIRNTFEVVPDAPVSRFVLEMKGGKKYGLLENSENVCRRSQRANARFVAQNGRVSQLHPKIANSCGKGGKKGR